MVYTVDMVNAVDTATNIAVLAHDGLWELIPRTLFTLLTLGGGGGCVC